MSKKKMVNIFKGTFIKGSPKKGMGYTLRKNGKLLEKDIIYTYKPKSYCTMELNKFKWDDQLGKEGPWIQVSENISFCDRDSEILKVYSHNEKWKWALFVGTPFRDGMVRIPPFEL